MSENKDSDEREQISKNNEETVSDVIEDLKVGKLSLHKHVDNIETESDERNLVDMRYDK